MKGDGAADGDASPTSHALSYPGQAGGSCQPVSTGDRAARPGSIPQCVHHHLCATDDPARRRHPSAHQLSAPTGSFRVNRARVGPTVPWPCLLHGAQSAVWRSAGIPSSLERSLPRTLRSMEGTRRFGTAQAPRAVTVAVEVHRLATMASRCLGTTSRPDRRGCRR